MSCAIVGWLLLQVPPTEVATIGRLIAVCVVFYVVRSRFRSARIKAEIN